MEKIILNRTCQDQADAGVRSADRNESVRIFGSPACVWEEVSTLCERSQRVRAMVARVSVVQRAEKQRKGSQL